MTWKIDYLPEAREDLRRLDGSQQIFVQKAIKKVSRNPLSMEEGGYGKPLGRKRSHNLTGLFKIKLRGIGIRVVYKLIREKDQMIIVVIGVREDEEVYELAAKRKEKYGL
ncbi:MAG: type II toxin-antitoxin system RelE/ParE family toxin [Lachnospiraceae bacterium]|nr:type II toxin-antitoxin system RelE/ParE family toxin [Lachnospiraceae bacterium]